MQKKAPAGYEAEVPVRWASHQDGFTFEIKGRIDGVLVQAGSLLIEEIKTVRRVWAGPPDPLHSGQARIYAHLYAQEFGFKAATVRITYYSLQSEETECFEEVLTSDALNEFFDSVLREYIGWIRQQQEWCARRNASIKTLPFPFAGYREGQRALAVAVYRTIQRRGRFFAEAPTGIGKTVSVLFPAIKAMGEGRGEKIFYLTAKTIGRAVAEETLALLRASGLRLRAVSLTAREKICFKLGEGCELRTCPFAVGYYDRIKGALGEALEGEVFTRPEIEALARKHQVCPFELSLDLCVWADVIICDYNYVFDPSASLKRFFDEERHDFVVLIDEAHNLVDRAREMFSAELRRSELLELQSRIEADLPSFAKTLKKLGARIGSLHRKEQWRAREGVLVSRAAPDLAKLLEKCMEEAELWLAQEIEAPFRQDLLQAYFRLLSFQRVLELFDERYVALYESTSERLRLFCVDPSSLLRRALEETGSAIFFSATLRPAEHFRQALGGDLLDGVLQMACPFPPENLRVLLQGQIATRLRERAASRDAVAESIAALTGAKRGNYLVFLPSYAYLSQIVERYRELLPEGRIQVQTCGMTEPEREQFLREFEAGRDETLVGFAVLGSLFSEGIDLVGERLIGVVIVGVGLPQICIERELIKECSRLAGCTGFDYAYTFPGLNRVLQGVGRVIRSETDRGIVLLIDQRFSRGEYRRRFPDWWAVRPARSAEEIRRSAQEFWRESESGSVPEAVRNLTPGCESLKPA